MISPQVIRELLTVRQVLHYLPASPKTEKGWTAHEQQLFWDALTEFPQGPWTTIAEFIGTKSTRQAMTHGQKLRQKLNRWRKRLRRTPAAAAALAEDPMVLDDDVRASMVLNSVMITSSALPVSSMMPMARNTSPIATSVAASVMTAVPTTLSVATTTMTAGAPVAAAGSLDSHHGLHFDTTPALPHYNTRSSSRQLTHNMSYDLDAIAATSSGLAEVDASYTQLLMASFPPAPVVTSPYASVPPSAAMLQSSVTFDRMGLSVHTTSMPMSMPSPLVSSERLASHHHVRHNSHAAHRRPAALSQSATPAGVAGHPSFYPDDERYVIPQSMVDDLADVLWDHHGQ